MPPVDREPVGYPTEALEHFSKAEVYLRLLHLGSLKPLGEPLDVEYTDTDNDWVAKGVYRQDENVLEEFTITKRSGEEYRIASFDIEVKFTNPDYGADQVKEYLGFGHIPIPGVDSVTYQVYLDADGFHVDVTEVDFDWDGADEKVLDGLESFFSDDGLTASVPGPKVRLQQAVQKANLETYENLLFTLEHLEPVTPATA